MAEQKVGLKAVVSADMTEFAATMKRVSASARKVGSRIAGSMARGTKAMVALGVRAGKAALQMTALGAAVATAVTVRNVKQLYDLGGALSDLSAQTGIAVKELTILQRAFEDNGVSGDKVGQTVNKMQRAIMDLEAGLSTQVRSFDRLGLVYTDLENKSPLEQFQAIQTRIAAIEDPTKRAATAMEIFGRSGGELLTLFSDAGAIENATESLGSAADILDRNAQTFDRISDLMNSAGAKLQQFFLGMAEVAAPKILAALERFNSIDFADIGMRLVRGLNLERALSLMKATFSVAASFLGNAVVNALAKATQFFADTWGKKINALVEGLETGLKQGMRNAAQMLLNPIAMIKHTSDAVKMQRESGKAMGEGVLAVLSKEDPFNLQDSTAALADAWSSIIENPTASVKAPSPTPAMGGDKSFTDGKVFVDSDAGRKLAETFSKSLPNEMKRTGAANDLLGIEKRRVKFQSTALAANVAGHHAAGFSGLAGLAQMQLDKMQGIGPGQKGLFAQDRARLGIGSGLSSGGLGEKRAVGRQKSEEELKRQTEMAKSSEEHLFDIKENLKKALTVS